MATKLQIAMAKDKSPPLPALLYPQKYTEPHQCHFYSNTIETHIKEPRFFFGSVVRFLIESLVFLIPACKVPDKVLVHSICLAHMNNVFSTRILDN